MKEPTWIKYLIIENKSMQVVTITQMRQLIHGHTFSLDISPVVPVAELTLNEYNTNNEQCPVLNLDIYNFF